MFLAFGFRDDLTQVDYVQQTKLLTPGDISAHPSLSLTHPLLPVPVIET